MTYTIPALATFITYNSITKTFTISPLSPADTGLYTIPITLADTAGYARTYYLYVSVISSLPPIYDAAPVTYGPVTVALNSAVNVPIFANHDPDGFGGVIVLCEDTTVGVSVNCIVAADNSFITFAPLTFD